MASPLEQRLSELEKKVEDLAAELRQKHVATKDWHAAVGTLVEDDLSREADRLGAEWRIQQREP